MTDNNNLQEKLSEIEKINAYQSKHVSALLKIFSLKRKADTDYVVALEQVNTQIDRYLQIHPGFLTQIIKSFQSLLAITHTHKVVLLEGYDNQVLKPLNLIRDRRIDQSIVKKVQFTQAKVNSQISLIKEKIQKLKWVDDEIQMYKTQAKLKDRMGGMTELQTIQHAEKLREILKKKLQNEQSLDKGITELQSISQLYGQIKVTRTQIKTDLLNYQNQYFASMTEVILDNVMRIFVQEVAYIRSIQHDVTSILKRLKDNRDQCKKSTVKQIKLGMKSDNITSIKSFLWDTYKNITKVDFNFNQPYVPQSAKKKLEQLCFHFKQLM